MFSHSILQFYPLVRDLAIEGKNPPKDFPLSSLANYYLEA